jgi:hypothetical protein
MLMLKEAINAKIMPIVSRVLLTEEVKGFVRNATPRVQKKKLTKSYLVISSLMIKYESIVVMNGLYMMMITFDIGMNFKAITSNTKPREEPNTRTIINLNISGSMPNNYVLLIYTTIPTRINEIKDLI